MIIAALAMTTLFAQATETEQQPEDAAAKAVQQATENAPVQKDANTATEDDAEKKAEEKSAEKE